MPGLTIRGQGAAPNDRGAAEKNRRIWRIWKMSVNGIGATGYPAAGKAMVRQAQDGAQRFDREMASASQTPPSFVGKVWTKEELMQSVDEQVRSNQSKKMSVSDMVKATCIEGTRARFRFAGEDKIYTFDEYIKELDKRSKENA